MTHSYNTTTLVCFVWRGSNALEATTNQLQQHAPVNVLRKCCNLASVTRPGFLIVLYGSLCCIYYTNEISDDHRLAQLPAL